MIHIIDDNNLSLHGETLEAAYRFRHEHFVGRLGWEACRRPDEREIDQFDGPGCVHIAHVESGNVTGYSRLLPTTRPHLLSAVYPQLAEAGPAPSGPRIYEWTRCGVSPSRREGHADRIDPVSARVLTAVAEYTQLAGLEGLLGQTHPILVNRLMSCGWDVEPLGLPTIYDGEPIIAIYLRLTPHTIAMCRAFFDLSEPVLTDSFQIERNWPGHGDIRLNA